MITNNRQAILFLALIGLALVMGGSAVGLMLVDFGPPLAVRIVFALIPFTLIPFVIGWLYPALWWAAGMATRLHLLFVITALVTAPPQTIAALWQRSPLFLPFLLTFSFAYLGRLFHFSAL